MATIAEQLTELVSQKKALVANLTTKGVASTEDEKLNTLVPKILQIEGINTSDATATEDDILLGKTAYVDGEKIEGTILSQVEQTIMPSTIDKTISKGIYIAGTQTIKGDENLQSGNIKKGITIFDVLGTLEEGVDTSDADATELDLLEGKTAYVNGEKIEGIIPVCITSEVTPSTIDQTLSGCYIDGTLTVLGDADLTADNIKTGVSVFGIDGTFTSDADAIASDILSGKMAYVNGEKITGTYVDSSAAEQFVPESPYTPITTDITLATENKIVSSDIVISGDANLLAENIKAGVSIFGITGTYGGLNEQIVFDANNRDNIVLSYNGTVYTLSDFVALYPDFCSEDNNYALFYGNVFLNWNQSVYTTSTKAVTLSSSSQIAIRAISSSSQTGILRLVAATGSETAEEILTAAQTEGSYTDLSWQWFYGTDYITALSPCTGIETGEYYVVWVGVSDNSHPYVQSVFVISENSIITNEDIDNLT